MLLSQTQLQRPWNKIKSNLNFCGFPENCLTESSDICRLYLFNCNQDKQKTESGRFRPWEEIGRCLHCCEWSHKKHDEATFSCHFHTTNPTGNIRRKMRNSSQRMHEPALIFCRLTPNWQRCCLPKLMSEWKRRGNRKCQREVNPFPVSGVFSAEFRKRQQFDF